MAASRKRPSSRVTSDPQEDTLETTEVETFLDSIAEESLIETEEKEVQAEKHNNIIREITPTEDLGPRFVETPVVEENHRTSTPEVKRQRPHPRNIPRFTRLAK